MDINKFEFRSKLEKLDSEKQIVYGFVSVADIVDRQNEIVVQEALQEAVEKYMIEYREGIVSIDGLHQKKNVGKIIESSLMWLGSNLRWYVGVKITDPEVWATIKTEGVTGFSVGGKAIVGNPQEVEKGMPAKLIKLMLSEFSVVYGVSDNGSPRMPANQLSTTIAVKQNKDTEMNKTTAQKLKESFNAFIDNFSTNKGDNPMPDPKKEEKTEQTPPNEEVKKTPAATPAETKKVLDEQEETRVREIVREEMNSVKSSVDEVKTAITKIGETLDKTGKDLEKTIEKTATSAVPAGTVKVGENLALSKKYPQFHKHLMEVSKVTNPSQVKKAILPASFTYGLSVEEATEFLTFLVEQSAILKKVRTEIFSARSKKIAKLGFGSRLFKPATTNTSNADTVSLTTGEVELIPKQVAGITFIGDDAIEDNIEGAAFVDKLIALMMVGFRNETEEAFLAGDTSLAADGIKNLFDSWYKMAKAGSAHVIEAMADAAADKREWPGADGKRVSRLLKKLPAKYRGNKQDLVMVMSDDLLLDAYDKIAGRNTLQGDQAFIGAPGEQKLRNVPIAATSLYPLDRAFTYSATPYTDGTDVMLTPAKNLIVGFNRELNIEFQRQARLLGQDVVMSARLINAIEETDAVAIYDHLMSLSSY